MSTSRHRGYRLLCPIARALDRIGDRWALLILRDLHAGPARFKDLQSSLPGLASNLLTTRLHQLQDHHLVERYQGPHSTILYRLTEDGEATAPVLFELAAFGARYAPPADPRRPGNLRTVAVTLAEALRRVVDQQTLAVELVVDGEPFAITHNDKDLRVVYEALPEANLRLEVGYEAMIDVADGRLSPREFASDHVVVSRGSKRAASAFLSLLGRAFAR